MSKEQSKKQGPLGPKERWSARRKRDVVLRLMRGEAVGALSRQLGVEIYRLEQWREMALLGIDEALHCCSTKVEGAGAALLDLAAWREEMPARQWRATLKQAAGDAGSLDAIRRNTCTGRPLGTDNFVSKVDRWEWGVSQTPADNFIHQMERFHTLQRRTNYALST